MFQKMSNLTIRADADARANLAELGSRIADTIGLELSQSDLVRISIKHALAADPADLFRRPQEHRR
jgi:hypothetical protein